VKNWTVDSSAEDWRKRQGRGDRFWNRWNRLVAVIGGCVLASFLYFSLSSSSAELQRRAIILLLLFIAWELHRIHKRLANGLPTEEEKERRYARWWAKLPTEQKAWYQQHPEQWKEVEQEVRKTFD